MSLTDAIGVGPHEKEDICTGNAIGTRGKRLRFCATIIIVSTKLGKNRKTPERGLGGIIPPHRQVAGLFQEKIKDGGASRDRTDGLVVANDALSQLSYSPIEGIY
jgi:hypothetical protein